MRAAREASRRLNVELVARQVASVEELRAGLRALRPGEFDGYLHVSDAMMISQVALIIDVTKAKKLPIVIQDRESVGQGALASYGLSYYTIGRLSAKPIHRVLLGADPGDMPIEQLDRLQFVINVKTVKAIGLTIPQSVLGRADEIIE